MEESFGELFEQYGFFFDMEEEEKKEESQKKKRRRYPFKENEYISMQKFVHSYLNLDGDYSNFMHCGLKMLECPFVFGVDNDFANKNPEYVKRGVLLLVLDCKKKRGTYINPLLLKRLLEEEDLSKEIKLLTKIGIHEFNRLQAFYQKYLDLKNRVEENECFLHLLEETQKNKKFQRLKRTIERTNPYE